MCVCVCVPNRCVRQYRDSRESRHAFNGLKYCTSISVVVLSFFQDRSDLLRAMWWAVSIVSTVCALLWDLKMDWGHPGWSVHAQRTDPNAASARSAPPTSTALCVLQVCAAPPEQRQQRVRAAGGRGGRGPDPPEQFRA